MMGVSRDLGVVRSVPLVGGVKKEDFETYINDLCGKLEEDYNSDTHLGGRKKYMVFFDNCPAHSKIENSFDAFPNVLPKRLPRYSPELNVVEFCFSFYKAAIKKKLRVMGPVEQHRQRNENLRQCRTRILLQLAHECTSVITPHSVEKCFSHVLAKVIPKAMRMEDM